MQTQKICFKGAEVLALVKGYPLSAETKAKLQLIKGSTSTIRLQGMHFHYAMENLGCLYIQLFQTQDQPPPLLTFGDTFGVDFEALD